MRKYRNKITNNNTREENYHHQIEYPSYQVSQQYHHQEFPSGYEKSHHIVQKMQTRDPHNKNSKISSKSEKYYTFYTEESSPKVNFEGKNTAKKYMNKRAYTPNRMDSNSINDSEYISELREEYSNPVINNRVNIRKKVYRGNKTPQPYTTNEYQEYQNDGEEFLDNYG